MTQLPHRPHLLMRLKRDIGQYNSTCDRNHWTKKSHKPASNLPSPSVSAPQETEAGILHSRTFKVRLMRTNPCKQTANQKAMQTTPTSNFSSQPLRKYILQSRRVRSDKNIVRMTLKVCKSSSNDGALYSPKCRPSSSLLSPLADVRLFMTAAASHQIRQTRHTLC